MSRYGIVRFKSGDKKRARKHIESLSKNDLAARLVSLSARLCNEMALKFEDRSFYDTDIEMLRIVLDEIEKRGAVDFIESTQKGIG